MNARKMDTHQIVSLAREATQMAEDARTIALKRRDEDRRSKEIQQSQEQNELRRRADEEAAQARAAADREAAERASAEQARAEAERDQAIARQQAALANRQAPPAIVPSPGRVIDQSAAQRQLRAQLFAQLNGTLLTRDTPRGLVVTIGGSMFGTDDDRLREGASQALITLARVLAVHPGLRAQVEGYDKSEGLSNDRAHSVRTALIASGAPGNMISAAGYGSSRPITAPASAEQNHRVEIVISGDSIGNRALWDHPYTLSSQR
jgi:flagellar motor protein MotB